MNATTKETLALAGVSVAMLGLAGSFLLRVWGPYQPPSPIPPTPPEFTNTATVRMSAAELTRTGGDTSGLACYSCHDDKKPVQMTFDAKGAITLPEAHKDLVIHHGRSGRNDHCFGCHDPKNLEQLRVRDGKAFKLTESNQLCGSCHGPTYEDWEHHLHGRVSGSWLTGSTNQVRQDCTSCHDPHSPAFPSIKPAPAPHPRLLQARVHSPEPKAH